MYIPNTLATLKPFVTAYTESDAFGKLIMLGLVAMSLVCWLVLANKIKILKAVRKASADFERFCEENKDNLLALTASQFAAKSKANPFFNIFASLKQKTLDILNKNRFFIEKANPGSEGVYLSQTDLDLLESHVYITISSEVKNLEKNLFILSTIVTLAPFLGLLGTVWGILVTFAELNGGASASHNSVILGGLSMALATTVMGLLIAIPALISYNYLKNDLKVFSSDMEDFTSKLISTLELQYRQVDIS